MKRATNGEFLAHSSFMTFKVTFRLSHIGLARYTGPIAARLSSLKTT